MQSTAIPHHQDPSSGARLEAFPIPNPEHLPSCPELARPFSRSSCVDDIPKCSLETPQHTYPFVFSPRRRAFPREYRFLRTSHPALAASLRTRRVLCFWSSRSLERAPEGCRDTSNRLLPPNLVLLSTSLHPCSRRSKHGYRLAPIRFERPAGSRRRACWGGTVRSRARYSLANVVTIFAAWRLTPRFLFAPFGLSAERARA